MRYQNVFALFLLATLFCGSAVAQPNCSIQTVVGTWAAESQGTVFVTPPGVAAPVATPGSALGVVSVGYGGEVHVELTGIMGANVGDLTLDGTLTVNPDCTGRLPADTSSGWKLVEEITILDHGNEIWTIAVGGMANYPAVWQCKWRRIGRVPLLAFKSYSSCSLDMIRGTWVSSSSSVAPVVSALSTIGRYDSAGRVSGTWTASINGQIVTGTGAGWITEVNPDCTGKTRMLITGADGTPYGEQIGKFVILNGGNEIWAMTIRGFSGAPVVGLERRYRISPGRSEVDR